MSWMFAPNPHFFIDSFQTNRRRKIWHYNSVNASSIALFVADLKREADEIIDMDAGQLIISLGSMHKTLAILFCAETHAR